MLSTVESAIVVTTSLIFGGHRRYTIFFSRRKWKPSASLQVFLINFGLTSNEFAEWCCLFLKCQTTTVMVGLFIDISWKWQRQQVCCGVVYYIGTVPIVCFSSQQFVTVLCVLFVK